MWVLFQSASVFSDPVDLNNLSSEQQSLIDEHIYGGIPGTENIHIRKGYILNYNPTTKTPDWVAYHVKPNYRKTPKRKGKFSSFRKDPDIAGEPSTSDYVGLMNARGYARGHLAPYGVMGGDRDGDGKYAVYGSDDSDEDDELTVRQGNYMTNIAPQHHNGFNGSPGLWWKLERWIQDDLVEGQGKEVWIYAGCIFGPGHHEKVTVKKVWVPPMFYKIVIMKKSGSEIPDVLAFLFPHQRIPHGKIQDFLVSVNLIEALSGEDFFRLLSADDERALEDIDTWETWKRLFDSN
jgi:endonuclease G